MASQADTTNRSILAITLGWLTVALALSLPIYRQWVSLATTAIIVLWIFGGSPAPRIRRLRGHRLTMAVLFFLALNVASLLWTEDPGAGLKYLTKYRYLLLIPMLASVIEPASTLLDSDTCKELMKNASPNRPNTMDGTPASVLMLVRIIRTTRLLSCAYSTR